MWREGDSGEGGRRGVGDEKLCLNVATICLYNVGGTEKQFIEAIAIIN